LAFGLVSVSGCSEPKAPNVTGGNGNTGSNIDGVWTTSCVTENDSFKKFVLNISGSISTKTEFKYEDASCTTEISQIAYQSSFALGTNVATPVGALAFEQTVTKMIMTLKSQELVQLANGTPEFGMPPLICGGGFTINVPKELTASTCQGDEIYSDLFQKSFDIVKLDGDKLYFGQIDKTNDGSSAANRPKQLETMYYTKRDSGGTSGSTTGSTTISYSTYVGHWQSGDVQFQKDELIIHSIDARGLGTASSNRIFMGVDISGQLVPDITIIQQINLNFVGVSSVSSAYKVEVNVSAVQVRNHLTEPQTYCGQTISGGQTRAVKRGDCANEELLRDSFDGYKQIFKVIGNMLYFGACGTGGDCVASYPTSLGELYFSRKQVGQPLFSIMFPESQKVGVCEKYTLKADMPLTANRLVSLNGGQSGSFYSDQQCTQLINSSAPLTMFAGSDSADFYFLPTVSSAPEYVTIDARDGTDPGLTGLASVMIEVQNSFTLQTPNTNLTVGQCYPFTVSAQSPLSQSVEIRPGAYSDYGPVYTDPSCQTQVMGDNRVELQTSGSNSATLYFKPSQADQFSFAVGITPVGEQYISWYSEPIDLSVSE
jgi:hypothetical protein